MTRSASEESDSKAHRIEDARPDVGGIAFSLQHLSGTRKGLEDRYLGDRVTIGRGRNNDCTFDAERERSVSHRHCEIRLEEAIPILYDIGSLNGTYLNGRRVRRSPIADGDEIGLGREGPRLRFLIRSGRTPDAILPGAAPEEIPIRVAGTAAERRNTATATAATPATSLRRTRWILISAFLAILATATIGTAMILRLKSEVRDLQHLEDAPASSSNSQGGATFPPAPKKTEIEWTQTSATLHILVTITDADGQAVFTREVGSGMVAAPGYVLTTLPVLDGASALLQAPPSDKTHRQRLYVAAGGQMDARVPVTHTIGPEEVNAVSYAELAVLVLDAAHRDAFPRRLLTPPGAKALKTYVPGLASTDVNITQFLNSSGSPVSRGEIPTLLRAANLPPMAGTPLFSGEDISALSLGSFQPGLAVSAGALQAFLSAALRATPHPLR